MGSVPPDQSVPSAPPPGGTGGGLTEDDPDDDEANRRMPFATIVTHDYEGFDVASDLNRPGVFRLNIQAGRAAFEELLGYPPAEHASQAARFDYAARDQLIPNPLYAAQGWVSIVSPRPATALLARSVLTGAHARAARRHERHG